MDKVIAQALGEKKPGELKDLHIEATQLPKIEGLTEDFNTLEELEILNCGLKTLDGFPSLPSVKCLLLGDNLLKGKEETETIVAKCPNVEILSLVGNRFESLDDIEPLGALESLTSLDLFNCPLTQQSDYRDKVIAMLPKLGVLDGYDRDGKEVADEEEEEEEEVEEEDDSDEEVGLEYLQKELSDSEDEEEYDPNKTDSPPSDDHDLEDQEEEEENEGGESGEEEAGPSRKRPKLDPPVQEPEDGGNE